MANPGYGPSAQGDIMAGIPNSYDMRQSYQGGMMNTQQSNMMPGPSGIMQAANGMMPGPNNMMGGMMGAQSAMLNQGGMLNQAGMGGQGGMGGQQGMMGGAMPGQYGAGMVSMQRPGGSNMSGSQYGQYGGSSVPQQPQQAPLGPMYAAPGVVNAQTEYPPLDPARSMAVPGVRSAWSLWPSSRTEAASLEVSLGLVYTPFREEVPCVGYEPIRSRQGGSVISPLCHVDYRAKFWVDQFSGCRNPFPPAYCQHLTEQNKPVELMTNVLEYTLTSVKVAPSVVHILVVDINIYPEELEALRDVLQGLIALLPPDTIIGLITYGTVVNVHELGFNQCVKTHVFRGTKVVAQKDLFQHVRADTGPVPRLAGAKAPGVPASNLETAHRFVARLGDCENVLNLILAGLQKDSWPLTTDNRASRCTGAALSAAVSMMEIAGHERGGRIHLFAGGVCTIGPGQIVGSNMSESIRQHQDLQKETQQAKYFKSATKFYSE